MTFRELEVAIDAWSWNMQLELERSTIMAWKTAAWGRAKKMPSLELILKKMRRKEKSNKPVDPNEARRIGKMAEDRLRQLAQERGITGSKK